MYIFLFFFSLQKEKEDNNTYNKKLKLLVVCDVINLVKVLYDIKDRTKKFVMSNKNRLVFKQTDMFHFIILITIQEYTVLFNEDQ